MKKEYITPEAEITKFKSEDIITTSGTKFSDGFDTNGDGIVDGDDLI